MTCFVRSDIFCVSCAGSSASGVVSSVMVVSRVSSGVTSADVSVVFFPHPAILITAAANCQINFSFHNLFLFFFRNLYDIYSFMNLHKNNLLLQQIAICQSNANYSYFSETICLRRFSCLGISFYF